MIFAGKCVILTMSYIKNKLDMFRIYSSTAIRYRKWSSLDRYLAENAPLFARLSLHLVAFSHTQNE